MVQMSLLEEHDSADLTSTSRHRCDFGARMTTPSGADRRTRHHEQDFSIAWAVIGVDASQARAAGEVDLATAPLLVKTLQTALDKTRLVLLDLQEITFMDASGLHGRNVLFMAFYNVTHSGFVLVSMVCFSIVMSSLRDLKPIQAIICKR